MKVKRLLYNQTPKTEEEFKELIALLGMVLQHVKKGMIYRIMIEGLEDLEKHQKIP